MPCLSSSLLLGFTVSFYPCPRCQFMNVLSIPFLGISTVQTIFKYLLRLFWAVKAWRARDSSVVKSTGFSNGEPAEISCRIPRVSRTPGGVIICVLTLVGTQSYCSFIHEVGRGTAPELYGCHKDSENKQLAAGTLVIIEWRLGQQQTLC